MSARRAGPASADKPRRIALALTGASGAVYGLRTLEELLRRPELEVHLVISPSGQKVLAVEHNLKVNLARFSPAALKLPKKTPAKLVYHHHENVAASLASGSFDVEAMAIVPCSMGCAGKIAHGISGDLVERAADVMIKERRPLVIVPRETPLSAIHLENLLTLAKLGVTVLPAAPGFYGQPQSVDDLVDFVVARVLKHLGLDNALGPKWGERET